MSFARLIPMPVDKGGKSFGQSHDDPRNDLFNQYLTFNTENIDGSIFLTAPESTLLVSKMQDTESGTSPGVVKNRARHRHSCQNANHKSIKT
jgi:hypothetical protein